jgi:hypothetical protein
MSADTQSVGSSNRPDAAKVRLLTIADLDGRTNAAKSAKALIADIESDLGGADRLSTGKRVLVGRAAITAAMIEHIEASWLSGRPVDTGEYNALVNSLRRLLSDLGLERKPRDVTPDLAVYVARSASVAPARTITPVPE